MRIELCRNAARILCGSWITDWGDWDHGGWQVVRVIINRGKFMRVSVSGQPFNSDVSPCRPLTEQSNAASNSKIPRAVFIATLVIVLTIAHFSAVNGAHSLRAIHILLAGMYIIPILAAALWFGVWGGIITAVAISLAYFAHMRIAWPNQPAVNASQMGMIAIYWVFAASSAVLVWFQERERRRRWIAEERSERTAVIQAICGLLSALRVRDEYTQQHSEHVAALAVEIAKRCGLSDDRIQIVRLAALVHDIGKIGIRDDVLLKPEELSDEERISIERHPTLAAEILRPIHGAREIADIVLAHHECPDGSGYPHGWKQEQIPTEAHIIHAADVFCSLTESRPYKEALPPATVKQIMDRIAGTKLDAESVRLLEEITGLAREDTAQRAAA